MTDTAPTEPAKPPAIRPPRGQALRLRLGIEGDKQPVDAATLHGIRRTLVVVAHMDDEINTSGLLSRLRAAGSSIDIVVLTDGAANPRTDPAVVGTRTHFECRRDELHDAMQLLAIEKAHLPRYPDAALREHIDAAVSYLAGMLVAQAPDLVVTIEPNGLNHHTDHMATNVIVRRALARTGHRARVAMIALPRPFCWIFGSDFRSAGPVPFRTLTLTGDEIERKSRVCDNYRSQASTLKMMMLGMAPRRFFRIFRHEWYIWLDLDAAAAWTRHLD